MAIEIKIPSIGESITEVTLAGWQVEDGDYVEEGDIIAEIESDKATLDLPADSSGTITLKAEEGADLKIGDVVATLEEGEGAPKKKEEPKEEKSETPKEAAQALTVRKSRSSCLPCRHKNHGGKRNLSSGRSRHGKRWTHHQRRRAKR